MNHPVPLHLTFSDSLTVANTQQEVCAPAVSFSDFNNRKDRQAAQSTVLCLCWKSKWRKETPFLLRTAGGMLTGEVTLLGKWMNVLHIKKGPLGFRHEGTTFFRNVGGKFRGPTTSYVPLRDLQTSHSHSVLPDSSLLVTTLRSRNSSVSVVTWLRNGCLLWVAVHCRNVCYLLRTGDRARRQFCFHLQYFKNPVNCLN